MAAEDNFSAALHCVFHLLFHFLALFFSMQRTHQRTLGQAVANADLFGFLNQFRHEIVGNIIKQIQALNGQTSLTTVEETADRSGANGAINISVVTNDHRIAAAQFQRHMLEIFSGGLHNAPSGIRRAGEADLAHGRDSRAVLRR